MSNLAVAEQRGLANLASLDTPTLRGELARVLTVTAETLAYLAAVWRELERRGEDLSELRTGLGQYLPLIAAGQLDAEVVVRFAGRQAVLRAVATLPLSEQQRLARGGSVPVLTIDESGRPVETDVAATLLTGQQVRLAFDHGRIRSVTEQRNMLGSARVAASRRRVGSRSYRMRVDTASGLIHIGRMTVPIREAIDALVSAGVISPQDDRNA